MVAVRDPASGARTTFRARAPTLATLATLRTPGPALAALTTFWAGAGIRATRILVVAGTRGAAGRITLFGLAPAGLVPRAAGLARKLRFSLEALVVFLGRASACSTGGGQEHATIDRINQG